jgi:ribosomal protein L7/L12
MSMILFVILLFVVLIILLPIVLANAKPKHKPKASTTNTSDAGIRDLLAQGKEDEALHIYQRFTGADLFTAKKAIAQISHELKLGAARQEVEQRLRLGDKAGAIEAYQSVTGATLKDALEIVETMEHKKR